MKTILASLILFTNLSAEAYQDMSQVNVPPIYQFQIKGTHNSPVTFMCDKNMPTLVYRNSKGTLGDFYFESREKCYFTQVLEKNSSPTCPLTIEISLTSETTTGHVKRLKFPCNIFE